MKKSLPAILFAILMAASCSDGDGPVDNGKHVNLEGQGIRVRFDLERGWYDVARDDGTVILEHAFAEVEVGIPGAVNPVVYRSTDKYERSGSVEDVTDALGAGRRATVRMSGLAAAPDLVLSLTAYEGKPFFTAALEAENSGAEEMQLARLVPAKVEARRWGGLWVGRHPSFHRILENGSFFLRDYFVDLLPGDTPEAGETLLTGLVHGYQKGHSISNWNHAIKDLESGRAFVAGSLDFSVSSPMFNTAFLPDEARPEGERTPFTYWSAEYPLMPNGKPLPAGEKLSVGPAFILPDTSRPLEGLEAYASALKSWLGIALWNERGPENRVPTGWNSWTGSGSSGGYGATIDEDLMIQNLDAMAEEFRDFGGEWFQIDDGYEYFYGDWDWREDRFPNGSAWMADQIEAAGLIPGVWIAVFQVDSDSQTYAQHHEDGWFAERLPFVTGNMQILDLSHPDVLAWLTDRFRRIRAEGYHWVKTDFGYWALGAKSFRDPTVTREEAYIRGLEAIRAGLDEGAADVGGQAGDTFWLNVSMLGIHAGHADSVRPNLDTMPAWETEDPAQGRKESQGFKPTVRTIARRFYLHNRIYLFNHDMLFFRSHRDTSVPPVTQDEARCLLTAMCLSGSVAKLGEKIVEMEPAWIQDFRKVLPVFGRVARPLDLFETEYPEIWHLRVVPEEGLNTYGAGPAYDVVALFNWGANFDLTDNPYTELPDAARARSLDLASIGLDPAGDYVAREFWSGEVVDALRGTLTRTVQPHTVQLFAIRSRADRPQYLGGNRHLLQGSVEVRAIDWDAGSSTLSMTYDAAPGSTKAPFTHELAFRVPSGWTLTDTSVAGAAPGSIQILEDGDVVNLSFVVTVRQDVEIDLGFTGS